MIIPIDLHLPLRCTAFPDNLDVSPPALPRERNHTDLLTQLFFDETGKLWDDYGIDSKIVVSVISSGSQVLATNQGNVSPSRQISLALISTPYCHRICCIRLLKGLSKTTL